MFNAYSDYHIENETGIVKMDDKTYGAQDIIVYSEASVWKTGYRFKLFKNYSGIQSFIYLHSFLGFKNGLIIQDVDQDSNKMIVGRSQVALIVDNPPKGFYNKIF